MEGEEGCWTFYSWLTQAECVGRVLPLKHFCGVAPCLFSSLLVFRSPFLPLCRPSSCVSTVSSNGNSIPVNILNKNILKSI